MDITIEDFVVWVIVGAFVGSVMGALVKRKKEGFGRIMNLTVGLIGALIGGLLFKLLDTDKWNLGAPFTIKKENILAAVVGSIILLLVVALVRKGKGKKTAKD